MFRAAWYSGESSRCRMTAPWGVTIGLGSHRTGRLVCVSRTRPSSRARLARDSVDLSRFEAQLGDPEPTFFSALTRETRLPQMPCHLAATNPRVHRMIADNLDCSPLYSGVIRGTGPRYCPSIEDKVVRFADRGSHTLYIEPEGLESDQLYLNGFSTSLPPDVQLSMLRGIEGLRVGA